MSAEDTQSYGVGLYDSIDDITPGTWGYIARSNDPSDLWGPNYKSTAEEREIAGEASKLLNEEMLAPTAPRTLEELLALADPNLEDPALKLERERIIGGEIHFTDLGEGELGTIVDLRVEPRPIARGSELLEPHLVVTMKDRTWFDPGGSYVAAESDEWTFAISRITDYELGANGHSTAITFRDYPNGIGYVISRGHRDPRVQEAIDRERALNGNPADKLQRSIENGDYDPRLASFLGHTASKS